ncbi:LPXTG cell wall anchor domain-containing protein [Siminovitchia terrae]|uniref:LPXTG cell wall anchor domain-containing protein n=1 Tax=Siminovitchia terrae TaxID=1914933 RepID=A0A429X120_SIMTE|nr:LPXTG cell wall anchor domain-containing protein [Siminovitchia terrae]RST56908.1 LPXTG cell wall anchor domain-containing protein [Siminovitchia terrae]
MFSIPIAYAEEEPNVTENPSENLSEDWIDQEDVMAENDATFSTTILGSASLPPNEAAVFDEQDSAGDLEDETHTYQGLLNEYDVSVYEDTDLLQQARIPEDDMLMVELPAAEEREEPVTLAVQPQAENLQTGQKKKDGEIVPIQDGKLPALGERSSILYVGIGLLCLGSALFFFIRRRKQRQGGKSNA